MPEDSQLDPAAPTVSIVDVQFRDTGKLYQYDAGALPLVRGDRVLVSVERGSDLATVAAPPRRVPSSELREHLPRIIKRADQRELHREQSNLKRGREAQRICLHRIRERGLPMKLIQAEPSFDGSKVTFFFFSESRVDFRDLVRDLAQTLHTRIEMKQIGNRDETKMIGGVGPCGRELCCSSWLREFNAVSVKMAKEQGLSLNPSKLAGMCGRLKCCLRYEYATYVELGRALPAVGKKVSSVKGDGVVTRQHVLKQTVVLRDEDGLEIEATLEDLVDKKKN